MKIAQQGQVLELDPKKHYILFVKEDSILGQEVRRGHIEMTNGRIFFVGDMKEFKFVENSDRIKGIVEVKHGSFSIQKHE